MKYYVIILILLFAKEVISQEYERMFYGDEMEQYIDSRIVVNDRAIKGFYATFYSDLKTLGSGHEDLIAYPRLSDKFMTEKDSLKKSSLKIVNVIGEDGTPIMDGDFINMISNPLLVIEEENTGNIIYFKYDSKDESKFPFLLALEEVKQGNLCNYIDKNVDAYSGKIEYSSPQQLKGMNEPPIRLFKNFTKSNSYYVSEFMLESSSLLVGKKGLTVLFTDGTVWEKPSVSISVNVTNSGYTYAASIILSDSEMEDFNLKTIKSYKLYILDVPLGAFEASKLKSYSACLLNVK